MVLRFATSRAEHVGELVDTFGGHDMPAQQCAVASFLGGGDEGVQRRVSNGPVRIARYPWVPALGASLFVAQGPCGAVSPTIPEQSQRRGECQRRVSGAPRRSSVTSASMMTEREQMIADLRRTLTAAETLCSADDFRHLRHTFE